MALTMEEHREKMIDEYAPAYGDNITITEKRLRRAYSLARQIAFGLGNGTEDEIESYFDEFMMLFARE